MFLAVVLSAMDVAVLFVGPMVWTSAGGSSEAFPPFFGDNWEDYSGKTNDFAQWRNQNNGLRLTVVNALTDDWSKFLIGLLTT